MPTLYAFSIMNVHRTYREARQYTGDNFDELNEWFERIHTTGRVQLVHGNTRALNLFYTESGLEWVGSPNCWIAFDSANKPTIIHNHWLFH